MERTVIMLGGVTSLACRNCARTTEFEQPPCADGHGADCPEWYCTQCGAATIVGRQSKRWLARTRAAGQPMARATRRS